MRKTTGQADQSAVAKESSLPNRDSVRRQGGLWVVLALLVVTLIAHIATRESFAKPTSNPIVEHPGTLSGSDGLVSFSGRLDRGAVMVGSNGQVNLELMIEAADLEVPKSRQSTDLFVVLDRSGSMDGEKIEQARAAAQELVQLLGREDRFALISYSSGARVDIPLASVDSSDRREAWIQTIEGIHPEGGTNMSDGLDLALDMLSRERSSIRNTRLILISDGQANEGDSTIEGLSLRATRGLRLDTNLSAVGVGIGFNEVLMSTLADAGAGNFYFLENTFELASVFQQELNSARETVAKALEIRLRPAPGVQIVDAAGYPVEWQDGQAVFYPGSLFAGQERRLWLTLEVPHAQPGASLLGDLALAYRTSLGDSEIRREVNLPPLPQIACVNDQEKFYGAIDRETWARSVTEEAYGALEQKVANFVRQGQQEAAKREIDAYRSENSRHNQVLASAAVDEQLIEIEALEAEVDDAFEGRDQAMKQNILSKKKTASGWEGRRAGAKKKVPVDASKNN